MRARTVNSDPLEIHVRYLLLHIILAMIQQKLWALLNLKNVVFGEPDVFGAVPCLQTTRGRIC